MVCQRAERIVCSWERLAKWLGRWAVAEEDFSLDEARSGACVAALRWLRAHGTKRELRFLPASRLVSRQGFSHFAGVCVWLGSARGSGNRFRGGTGRKFSISVGAEAWLRWRQELAAHVYKVYSLIGERRYNV